MYTYLKVFNFAEEDTTMNKLHVALNLLKLLNERKNIDSAVVAGELNVSIRTAQRYLCELASLPCVSHDGQNHKFSLDPEYQLNKVLLDCMPSAHPPARKGSIPEGTVLTGEVLCSLCGGDCERAAEFRRSLGI